MMTAIIAWCAFLIGFFVGVLWAGRKTDDDLLIEELLVEELRRQDDNLKKMAGKDR
jgi:hypothetical protein